MCLQEGNLIGLEESNIVYIKSHLNLSMEGLVEAKIQLGDGGAM